MMHELTEMKNTLVYQYIVRENYLKLRKSDQIVAQTRLHVTFIRYIFCVS